MCSGSEAGSILRFIDFVYHSTLGLRVIQKRREGRDLFPVRTQGLPEGAGGTDRGGATVRYAVPYTLHP